MSDKLLKERLEMLVTRDIDLKGRRVINAGQSKSSSDYVTRAELDEIRDALNALKKIVDTKK